MVDPGVVAKCTPPGSDQCVHVEPGIDDILDEDWDLVIDPIPIGNCKWDDPGMALTGCVDVQIKTPTGETVKINTTKSADDKV